MKANPKSEQEVARQEKVLGAIKGYYKRHPRTRRPKTKSHFEGYPRYDYPEPPF